MMNASDENEMVHDALHDGAAKAHGALISALPTFQACATRRIPAVTTSSAIYNGEQHLPSFPFTCQQKDHSDCMFGPFRFVSSRPTARAAVSIHARLCRLAFTSLNLYSKTVTLQSQVAQHKCCTFENSNMMHSTPGCKQKF
jgi:hypothetical protein